MTTEQQKLVEHCEILEKPACFAAPTSPVQAERLIESIYQETVRVYREYLPV